MATTAELEKRIESLSRSLSEAESAIRRIGTQENNLVEIVSKLSAEVSVLKVEVANMKTTMGKLAQRPAATVGRYE